MMTNIQTSHVLVDTLTQRHARSVRLQPAPETSLWSGGFYYTMWHGAVYVNICLAQGVYSLSYLKKQIISGSAPLPCGTCSSFTEIILCAGRGSGSGGMRKRVKNLYHHVIFSLNAFNLHLNIWIYTLKRGLYNLFISYAVRLLFYCPCKCCCLMFSVKHAWK